MHHPSDEAQPLGGIHPVAANVVLCGSGVIADPPFEIVRAREDVCRVALFRDFDDYGALQLKYVLVPEQKELAAPLPQLIVEERIVIGFSGDLGDIEIGRDALFGTEPAQILPLERLAFDASPHRLNYIEVPAEAAVRLPRDRQGVPQIGGPTDLGPAWKCGFPRDQVPLAIPEPVPAAFHERGFDPEFRAGQVFPLVPRRIPRERQEQFIQKNLDFATAITVHGTAIEEFYFAERSAEAACSIPRQKRKNPGRKEGVPLR
jgi:hypothetical protein